MEAVNVDFVPLRNHSALRRNIALMSFFESDCIGQSHMYVSKCQRIEAQGRLLVSESPTFGNGGAAKFDRLIAKSATRCNSEIIA